MMNLLDSCLRLDAETARERFDLARHFDIFADSYYEDRIQEYSVLVCDGDLTLDGDLHLDWEPWPDNCAGLIVCGALHVNGSIINRCSNGGPFLCVRQAVSARHLLGGGAFIRIGGDVSLQEALYAHYNDGSLHIAGNLSAPLVINEDHDLYAAGKIDSEWFYDWNHSTGEEAPDSEAPSLPPRLRGLLVPEIVVWDDVFSEIASGQPVLTRHVTQRRSYEAWRTLIEREPMRLRSVPPALIDATLCETAVRKAFPALSFVPPALLTDALCEQALNENGHALAYIPEACRSGRLCRLAAERGTAIENIPVAHRSDEILEILLKRDGNEITRLDEARINRRLAIAAVIGGVRFLNLPDQWATDEIACAALDEGPRVLLSMSPAMVTPGVYAQAQARYGDTKEWAEAIKQHDPKRLRSSGEDLDIEAAWTALLDETMCIDALGKESRLYEIPPLLKTEKVCKAAIEADLFNFNWLPPEFMTPSLCARAVRHDYGKLIEVIPHDRLTPELCLSSVQANGNSLEHVPDDMRTLPVCMAALEESSSAYEWISLEMRDAVLDALTEKYQGEGEEGGYWFLLRARHRLDEQRPAGIDAEGAVLDARRAIAKGYDNDARTFFTLATAYRHLGDTRQSTWYAGAVLAVSPDFEIDGMDGMDTDWLKPELDAFIAGADEKTWHEAIESVPHFLKFAPPQVLTADWCEALIERNDDLVAYIPDELLTPALYAAAIRTGHKSLSDVPEEMLSEAACIAEVEDYGWRLERIPEKWRTFDVCKAAVMASNQAIPHVPEALQEAVLAAQRRERKESPVSDQFDGLLKRALFDNSKSAKILWIASQLFRPQGRPATLKGFLGWLELRPVAVIFIGLLVSIFYLAIHLWVAAYAWQSAGAFGGILSALSFVIADLYWAWEDFAVSGTTAFNVLAVFAVLLVVAWSIVKRRVATVWRAW